jgi:1,4-dihydroxy-2-naphthoate polyprenyltransferase
MNPSPVAAAMASMRLPFLTLPPACVALGAGVVHATGGAVSMLQLIIVLVGAVASHVAVNALNEYHDFRSGLDFATQRTPFSGGSGYLTPDKPRVALIVGLLASAVTAAVGLYFLYTRGWGLLPLGGLGLLTIVTYTRWMTGRPLICLVAPGLGFGTFMVLGTEYALSGQYTWTGVVASLVPFFLVSNLLLLNQFPDVAPDAGIGRRHLPIAIGRHRSAWVYTLFLAAAYVTVAIGVGLSLFPLAGLAALVTLLISAPTARGVLQHADDIPQLVPLMGRNVLITLATPALLSAGLFLGG